MSSTSTPVKRKPPQKRPKPLLKPAPGQKPRARSGKRPKQRPLRFWVALGVVVLLAAVVLYVELFVEKRTSPWPEGYSVYGIDVSHYQKEVDWQKVRENEIAFAFVKATEGKSLKDRKFEENWEGAVGAGIIRGAYHFYLPHLNPEVQAENFIATVKLSPGDLPPVLDIEKRGRKPIKQFRKELKVWLDKIEEAYGAKPIIYTGYNFYQSHLAGHFDDYHLWIAHYKIPKLKLEKSDKVKLAFWQHTEDGAIEGVEGNVDCNVFYGSMRDLRGVCLKPEVAN